MIMTIVYTCKLCNSSGRECNELRVTKPPNRYGAVAAPDTKWITSPERCLQHKLHNTDTLQGNCLM